MFTRIITAGAAATLFAYGAAQAQLITVDGDTTGAPSSNVFGPHQAVPFSVSAAGNVRLETIVGPTTFDTVLHLYSAFDPNDAATNLLASNDDGGGGGCGSFSCSLINSALAPGDYVAVVRGFAGSFGVFRLEIEGPVLVGVISMASAGDAGIMATEIAAMVTAAQSQGLRNIVRANQGARQAAGAGSMAQSMNGLSTTNFSVWAEIGGSALNAEFGGDLNASNFFGQAGIEAALDANLAVGLSVGGALTSVDTTASDLDGDALFVQPYVAYSADGLTAIASLIYTRTDYDDTLGVIDSGNRFAGSLFVGYDVPIAADTVATPFGFAAGGIERLDTTAGNENTDFLTARLGVELSRNIVLLDPVTLRTFASVAAEYVVNGDPSLGAPTLLTGYDDNRLGGRVEVGFDFTISSTGTQFFAAANGSGLLSDASSFGGNVGIKIPF